MVLEGPLGNEIHIILESWKIFWQDIGLKSNKSSAYIIRCESYRKWKIGNIIYIQQEEEELQDGSQSTFDNLLCRPIAFGK